MKRTNNMGIIMLVCILVSAVLATGIAILESFVGPGNVFIGAICLLPIVFIWMLVTDAMVKRSNKKNRGY